MKAKTLLVDGTFLMWGLGFLAFCLLAVAGGEQSLIFPPLGIITGFLVWWRM